MSDDALFDMPGAATGAARGASGTHTCVIPACRVTLPARLLMCRPHWACVPLAIRGRIQRLYRPGQTALTATPEYLAAVDEAIQAVQGAGG